MNDAQISQPSPKEFHLSVMMVKRPPAPAKAWLGDVWQVVGVVVNSRKAIGGTGLSKVRSGPEGEQYRWNGFVIRLHKDEAESYYHNLKADNPRIFVISAPDEQGVPKPFLVSASFDEARAYMEAEGQVDSVPMPPELYRWVEEFVLAHYVPERKIKRKRRNWSEDNAP